MLQSWYSFKSIVASCTIIAQITGLTLSRVTWALLKLLVTLCGSTSRYGNNLFLHLLCRYLSVLFSSTL